MAAEPTKGWEKLIRAAATVKTKNGLAALNIVMDAVEFAFAAVFLHPAVWSDYILPILVLVIQNAFATFAVMSTAQEHQGSEGDN